MSKAEYFVVFESLLYGLALAHILVSFSKMIMHWKSIQAYWLHLILVGAATLGLIQRYYSGYHGHDYQHIGTAWEFFFLIFLPMAAYFLLAYQLFPNKIKKANFKEFFWNNYKQIILTFIAAALVLVARNIAIDVYAIKDGRLNGQDYFTSPQFLVFALAILCMAGLGGVAVALKKKWMIKVLSIIVFLYTIFSMSTT